MNVGPNKYIMLIIYNTVTNKPRKTPLLSTSMVVVFLVCGKMSTCKNWKKN